MWLRITRTYTYNGRVLIDNTQEVVSYSANYLNEYHDQNLVPGNFRDFSKYSYPVSRETYILNNIIKYIIIYVGIVKLA